MCVCVCAFFFPIFVVFVEFFVVFSCFLNNRSMAWHQHRSICRIPLRLALHFPPFPPHFLRSLSFSAFPGDPRDRDRDRERGESGMENRDPLTRWPAYEYADIYGYIWLWLWIPSPESLGIFGLKCIKHSLID